MSLPFSACQQSTRSNISGGTFFEVWQSHGPRRSRGGNSERQTRRISKETIGQGQFIPTRCKLFLSLFILFVLIIKFSLVINLARQTNAPDLLPSAFYDLCRCSSSEIGSGYTTTPAHGGPAEKHTLSDMDLLQVFKGREHAARFLTIFIATQLESRPPSPGCLNTDASQRRICQATFEAITFEILRDVNGVIFHRASDPLFAMMDADLMQTSQRVSGTVAVGSPGSAPSSNGMLSTLQRACEPCRTEFSNVVDATREDMWHRLPEWFGIKDNLDWP